MHDRATVVILYIVCHNHHNHTTVPLGCERGLLCNITALWTCNDRSGHLSAGGGIKIKSRLTASTRLSAKAH